MPNVSGHREEYASMIHTAFEQAVLAGMKSHDFSWPDGAVILDNEGSHIGIGYGGLARGIEIEDVKDLPGDARDYYISAAQNAIYNALSQNLEGNRMFATLESCVDCTNGLLQTGITEIYFASDKHTRLKNEGAIQAKELFELVQSKKGRYEGAQRTLYTGRFTFDESTTHITPEEKHMATAAIQAKRSKDPNTQVGACIADSADREIGVGYNGFPRNVSDNDLQFSWTAQKGKPFHETKYAYVMHAEMNAILNTTTSAAQRLRGGKAFLTHQPKHKTVQTLVQAGIFDVYVIDRPNPHAREVEVAAGLRMLEYLDDKGFINYHTPVKPWEFSLSIPK